MISHKHKFIFIHINKCGGTSVRASLEKEIEPWAQRKPEARAKEARWYHAPLQTYWAQKEEPDVERLKKYFKFTFVRNPWARFVSLYFFRRKFKILKENPVSFKTWARHIYEEHPVFYTNANPWMLKNQRDWLVDNKGAVLLDFIGRTENFQEDFNIVCDKIKIQRRTLPHVNKTNHKHYTEYYDNETKEIVSEKYAQDIEYFGYKFGA